MWHRRASSTRQLFRFLPMRTMTFLCAQSHPLIHFLRPPPCMTSQINHVGHSLLGAKRPTLLCSRALYSAIVEQPPSAIRSCDDIQSATRKHATLESPPVRLATSWKSAGPLRLLPWIRIDARNSPGVQGHTMFSKSFSWETDISRPEKLFRKHRKTPRLPKLPSLSTLARPPEPERQPHHKAEGQRGELSEIKEVNHVRTQVEGHQGSGNLYRPSWLRGHRNRVGVRGRQLHRRGDRVTRTRSCSATCRPAGASRRE